jgi:hypothetical protein
VAMPGVEMFRRHTCRACAAAMLLGTSEASTGEAGFLNQV